MPPGTKPLETENISARIQRPPLVTENFINEKPSPCGDGHSDALHSTYLSFSHHAEVIRTAVAFSYALLGRLTSHPQVALADALQVVVDSDAGKTGRRSSQGIFIQNSPFAVDFLQSLRIPAGIGAWLVAISRLFRYRAYTLTAEGAHLGSGTALLRNADHQAVPVTLGISLPM